MRVDTNTFGNTFWFYFKVSNFLSECLYTFNILNFSRNLSLFYSNGMNILTMSELPH
jgi:hypothetical protein